MVDTLEGAPAMLGLGDRQRTESLSPNDVHAYRGAEAVLLLLKWPDPHGQVTHRERTAAGVEGSK